MLATTTPGFWKSVGASGPPLDVGPIPHKALTKCPDWAREVGMAAAPRVDDLRAGDAESLSDLGGSYELVHVNSPSHAPTLWGSGATHA